MSCHSEPSEHWQKGYLRGEINNVETRGEHTWYIRWMEMLESQCSAVLVRSEKARVRPESLACFGKIWLLCEDGKVLIKLSTEHHEHLMLK